MENKQTQVMSVDQVLQTQFTKVGQLTFQIEIMQQQLIALESENKELKEKLGRKKTV
jgi:hypothetical protein